MRANGPTRLIVVMLVAVWITMGPAYAQVARGFAAGGSALGSEPRHLTNVAGRMFFSADDGVHGRELWKSDGTATGTVLVKDIAPGDQSSNPRAFAAVAGRLFFTANDGTHGQELWTSDGTEAGTTMVGDLYPGLRGANPADVVSVRGRAFFTARDGVHGRELWRSDSTSAGTAMVKNINPAGGDASNIRNLTNVAGTLLFSADDGLHGNEIWMSDGTRSGTTMLEDLNTIGHDWSMSLTAVGDLLFFAEQTNDSQARNLWVTDGTVAGTTELGESAFDLVDVQGELFYGAFYNPGLLAKSDGTPAGTVIVKAPSGDSKKSNLHFITAVGDRAFFVAGDGLGGATGMELWVSDGTGAGTVLVKDINPSGQSYPSYLTDLNGELIFQATTHHEGAELWRSDGTEAGTVLVSDIAPGETGSLPGDIVPRGNVVFLRANDGVHGTELWRSDGTPSGTVMVADIA